MPLLRTRRPSPVALLLGVVAAALLAAGCSSTVTGTPVAAPTTPAASSTSEIPNDRLVPPTNTASGGDVSIDVAPGDCVRLGGTVNDATIEEAACGSDESNYVVVASSPTSSGCPSDVDQTYYETLDGVEQGALCLDIDFVVGGCMDLGGEDPVRTDCSEPMVDGVRVAEIVQDSVDEFDCDTDRAYVYDEREFVVCFDSP
ncbi:hypothetical protein SAMN05444374_10434 [Rhodococcoides kroppenstedtii]|uniref:LppU protein n=1 Tax=Rhodococcoides kroppenstedtii TaxID=293050 RepID=A0A1I0T3Z7_9NOCA|nr:hypothetical protein [Rhodococcus kroppenstedtii]SFA46440.1 hypothetical protein SAMN05444374_10434 [Rhodococcus kroppenstedtii]